MFQTALDEHRHIVAHLDNLQAQMDELTALQDATQAELDALLPSVLDRAFREELRVPTPVPSPAERGRGEPEGRGGG